MMLMFFLELESIVRGMLILLVFLVVGKLYFLLFVKLVFYLLF